MNVRSGTMKVTTMNPRGVRWRQTWLILLLVFTAGTSFAKDVYKWVDENGDTHYGDDPPADVVKQEVRLRRAPTADPAISDRRERTARLLDAFAAERREKQEERAAMLAEKKKRKRNCAKARSIQQRYENSAFIYTEDDAGERVVLDGEDYDKVIDGARADVEKWCG